MNAVAPGTMDQYIAAQPVVAQKILQAIRQKIQTAVPDATEAMSYGLPTYRINGKNMIHFGAYSRHIGVYATPDGHAQFEAELDAYKRGKGSVQFPIDRPMPYDLIVKMAVFRAQQLTKGMS